MTALGQSARAVEERSGITNAQLFVLQQLAQSDRLTINELAARALTQQSTVSLLVARLSRAKLVKRSRSPDDRRRVDVTLTAKGRDVVKNAPEPPSIRLIRAIDSLATPRVRELERSLGALLDAMGVAGDGTELLFEQPATTRARAK